MLRRGTAHRYGRDFMDSNLPSERKTDLAKMFWEEVEKFPAVARALCAR
jgi:hypothetical protein